MDSFLPNTAKVLLGILAAAFLLAVVVIALLYMEEVTTTVNRDQEAARFQQEYASLRRFQGEDIAYSEVLNAIYLLSQSNRPVIITTQAWFHEHTVNRNRFEIGTASLLRFPLPSTEIRNEFFGFGVPATTNFVPPNGLHGIWDGIQYDPATEQSRFRDVAEWLANRSRPNGLVFTGHILRNESGIAYAIVFTYAP